MKRRALLWLKVLVSAVLLVLLARMLPLAHVIASLGNIPKSVWLVNCLLLGAATALGGWRWHIASDRRIPVRTCLSYYWMGIFYSYILPGSFAGDLARTAALAVHEPQHRTLSLPVSVVLDRLGGLITTVLVLLLACAAMWWNTIPHLALLAGLFVGIATLCAFPFLLQRCARWLSDLQLLPEKLRRLAQGLAESLGRVSGAAWLRILLISFVIHIISCTSYAWGAAATGVQGEPWRVALYYAVFNLAVLLPITVAGVGLREYCAVWLLGSTGAAGMSSVALSWFVLAISLPHVVIGALLHFMRALLPKASPLPAEREP